MKSISFSRLSTWARNLVLASLLVLSALALLPVGPVLAQTATVTITPDSFDAGMVGDAYQMTFTVSGGTPPYTFVTSENVPGLSFAKGASTVVLSGTPTRAGSYSLSIKVTDKDNKSDTVSGTMEVAKRVPSLTISSVTTGHPSGTTFMVKVPVTVAVVFSGTSVADPTDGINVSGGTGAGAPSCTAAIDLATMAGECDLVYSSAGPYSISASYPGDSNYTASAVVNYSSNPISVVSFSVSPMLSAGNQHTCFQNSDGTFQCWGKVDGYEGNTSGVPIVYGPALAMSAGGHHTCMIKPNGTIECLGDTPDIKNDPDHAGRKFIAISSGGDFACAIEKRGDLYCWGTRPSGVNQYTNGPFKAISAGDEHVCALRKSSGSPVCWGSDTLEQSTPVPASLTGLKAISAGYSHTCAITSTGGLACWGEISGTPSSGSYNQLGSGSGYSCARNAAGKLVCWGDSNRPVVDTTLAVDGFTSGFLHACAWKAHSPKNYLACWGDNQNQQAPSLSLSPKTFTGDQNVVPLDTSWSQPFTPGGGFTPYTLTLQSATIPETALSGTALTWTPDTLGAFSFTLKLEENGAGSALPLELAPLSQAYSLLVQNPVTTTQAQLGVSVVNAGSPVNVTVTVGKDASATPLLSGTVTVTGDDGSHQNTCQAQVSSAGTASCSLYFAFSGIKTISAQYQGNRFYRSSDTVSTPTLTVNPVAITPVVSSGNQFTCSLDSTGIPSCWGKSDADQTAPIESVYNQLSAGDALACGRSLDTGLYCWGWDGYGLDHLNSGYYYSSVAAGSTHACGLSLDGRTIACWGNSAGGRTAAPAEGSVYSQISAGDNHTCALRANGTVACWGVNTNGQTAEPAATFSSISGGGTFSCGITTTGTLSCWGGIGTVDSIRSAPGGTFLSLDAGAAHACAVRSDHQVICWGSDEFGQANPPGHAFSSVSAGNDHTCGIREKTASLQNSVLECWGSNDHGQAPSLAVAPETLQTIDVGVSSSLQLEASGGRSGSYVFSVEPDSAIPAGLEIDTDTGLIHGIPVNAGEYDFTVRVFEDERTPALMVERAYHLVIRSQVSLSIDTATPEDGMVGRPFTVKVRVGETPGGHLSALPTGTVTVQSSDGKSCQALLTADGGTSTGSCFIYFTTEGTKTLTLSYPGDAFFLPGSASGQITIAPFNQAPQVYTTSTRTFVHRADGTMLCIGLNCSAGGLTEPLSMLSVSDNQACGLGMNGQVRCREAIALPDVILEVNNHGPYTHLAVGEAHACGIRVDGSVYCWGDNTSGQSSPPPGTFLAISASATRTCGIRSDSTLVCWGSSSTPPAGVFTSVSVGESHACALRIDGSLTCWGDNTSGQTGAPAGVFQAVSVGSSHTCALDKTGSVSCWGKNDAGQAEMPYGSFTALDSAGDHNCALRDGSSLTCWGDNQHGEAPRITVSELTDFELVTGDYWEFAFNPSGGTRPYSGSVSEGVLPQGINLGVNLSPAGVILYGTPQIPDDYPFTLKWEDHPTAARPIALSLEKAYSLKVTGGDLAVSIVAAGPVAMAENSFHFVYTFRNLSAIPVPSVRVEVQLPSGFTDISTNGITGCAQSGNTLTCALASLSPDAVQVLTIEGRVTARGGDQLSTSAEVQPLLATYPELSPGNNTAELIIPVAYEASVLKDPLDILPPGDHWKGGTVITSPSGITYLGDLSSGSSLRLVVDNLSPHQWVEVTFDLYIIGSWLGNNPADPLHPSRWSFGETGKAALLETTFCNQPDCTQAYPGQAPEGAYPAWTGAAGTNQLQITGVTDSRYRVTLRFDHSSSTLDLTFLAGILPPGALWGLDNVDVTIGSGVTLVYMPILKK